MKLFNKKFLVVATMSAVLMVSSIAVAAVSNVANTLHNFSYGGASAVYHDTNTTATQVCVYCHTPHNAGKTKLLWNKVAGAAVNFRLYTSSGTLRNATKASALTADSPSLLCLTCHDGKTAMNVLHTSAKGGNAASAGMPSDNFAYGNAAIVMPGPVYDFFSGTFGPSMNLGRSPDGTNDTLGENLTDDHPIGFSYNAVFSERPGGLFSVANVATKSSNSVRFFGSTNKVECSSCHDPHIDYSAAGNPLLKPFLVMDNSGSKLCLSCHDK